MALSPEFSAFIEDILAGFGPVTIKALFGGGGVYHDGLMFALIADDILYLKADVTTAPRFEGEDSEPFTFTSKSGKTGTMSYWQVPERLYDDVDELAEWAAEALSVAKAAQKRKKPKRSRNS